MNLQNQRRDAVQAAKAGVLFGASMFGYAQLRRAGEWWL